MIQHCCDANSFFDEKEAARQAKRFRRKGSRGATRQLIAFLKESTRPKQSLLDIGGGIGAIGLELPGLEYYTSVDASRAYQQQAGKLYRDEGWRDDQLQWHCADFVEVAHQLEEHHLVALDKVICCYPAMEKLLRTAASMARYYLALSYPLPGWIPSILRGVANLYFRLKKSSFRSYLHSKVEVHRILQQEGFQLQRSHIGIPWRVEIWSRKH